MRTRKIKSPDEKISKKSILDDRRKLSITPEEYPKRSGDMYFGSRKDKRKDSSPVQV